MLSERAALPGGQYHLNWGDGSGSQSFTLETGQRTFTLTHAYAEMANTSNTGETETFTPVVTIVVNDASLRASNANQTCMASGTVTIIDSGPQVALYEHIDGLTTTLVADVLDPGEDPAHYQYHWTVTDTTTQSVIYESQTGPATLDFTPPSPNDSYHADVTVTDDDGNTDSASGESKVSPITVVVSRPRFIVINKKRNRERLAGVQGRQ